MMENKYKVVNGISYHENTPDAVIRVLENAMRTNKRIRIFYGDTETDTDLWIEEGFNMDCVYPEYNMIGG